MRLEWPVEDIARRKGCSTLGDTEDWDMNNILHSQGVGLIKNLELDSNVLPWVVETQ